MNPLAIEILRSCYMARTPKKRIPCERSCKKLFCTMSEECNENSRRNVSLDGPKNKDLVILDDYRDRQLDNAGYAGLASKLSPQNISGARISVWSILNSLLGGDCAGGPP